MKLTTLEVFLLILALMLAAMDAKSAEPAPLAWTQETPPAPRSDFVATWRIEYCNGFSGPWAEIPGGSPPGRFTAGFMNGYIHELLNYELENHVTGNTPHKCFRFVQIGD